MGLGYCTYLLNLHDCKTAELKDLFSRLEHFLNGFLLHLLTTIYVFLWSLLFVIPGIVAAYSYAMTPYILAENPEMSATDALRTSKQIMLGHKWHLFCLDLSFIGWHLLAVFTLGISELFVASYQNQSRASFYRNLVPAPYIIDSEV